ncbi:hypothetical protein BH23ACT7_BH23ACT7_24350 [soil metagenome]|jgi:lipoprotein-anchoring transpeptidase ErfK/SrfK|nr:L,D-transpeptidase family protein [Euzebyaceae bacterium]
MSGGVAELGSAWQPVLSGGGAIRRAAWVARGTAWSLAGILLGLMLAVTWAATETSEFAAVYEGRILPGAVIGGVDVGGATPADAVAAVEASVVTQLDRRIELVHASRRWATSPRELGATSDATAAVAAAMAATHVATWTDLARMRFTGATLDFERDVTVVQDGAGARRMVAGLAAELDRPASDAAMDHSSGWVTFTPDQQGVAVAVDATGDDLVAALSDGREEVAVRLLPFAPAVTMAEFDQVLLLRQQEHKLYLYRDGEITHEWLVATGTGSYPTPTGEFEVELKRYLPTWVNPDPQGWGADLPASIGPGAGNPLGLRALNWSGGGAIRFHGTQAIGSLGQSASHGCVRMANADVIELYDLVDVGARIISIDA